MEDEELRRKTRGPLAGVSHTHSRPSTSEATADKNAKKRDEAGITSRSCLWIAVCILISVCVCEMIRCLLTVSQRRRFTLGPTSVGLSGKIKQAVTAME